MLQKCYQRRLIPLAVVALVLENELQYHGLSVRVNSGDEGATSSRNLLNFCMVTPEMTGNLRTSGMTRPKAGVYSLISLDILNQFSQLFRRMKALYVQMMDLYLIFQFVKER